MFRGYKGQILEIDLTQNSISKTRLDLDSAKLFIGGRGMISYLLWNRLKAGTDPLSPDNLLIFLTGPLTGINTGSNQTCVGFKQPETGTISHSITTGYWGPELKFSGYDGVIITGKAREPVYIYIFSDQ